MASGHDRSSGALTAAARRHLSGLAGCGARTGRAPAAGFRLVRGPRGFQPVGPHRRLRNGVAWRQGLLRRLRQHRPAGIPGLRGGLAPATDAPGPAGGGVAVARGGIHRGAHGAGVDHAHRAPNAGKPAGTGTGCHAAAGAARGAAARARLRDAGAVGPAGQPRRGCRQLPGHVPAAVCQTRCRGHSGPAPPEHCRLGGRAISHGRRDPGPGARTGQRPCAGHP